MTGSAVPVPVGSADRVPQQQVFYTSTQFGPVQGQDYLLYKNRKFLFDVDGPLRFRHINSAGFENPNPYPTTMAIAIYVGGTKYTLTWGGSTYNTWAPGAIATSDAIPNITAAKGSAYIILYEVLNGTSAGGSAWACGYTYSDWVLAAVTGFTDIANAPTLATAEGNGTPGSSVITGTASTTSFVSNYVATFGTGLPEAKFVGRQLYWTSGANVGATTFIQSYNNTTGAIVLTQPLPNVPSVGDIFGYTLSNLNVPEVFVLGQQTDDPAEVIALFGDSTIYGFGIAAANPNAIDLSTDFEIALNGDGLPTVNVSQSGCTTHWGTDPLWLTMRAALVERVASWVLNIGTNDLIAGITGAQLVAAILVIGQMIYDATGVPGFCSTITPITDSNGVSNPVNPTGRNYANANMRDTSSAGMVAQSGGVFIGCIDRAALFESTITPNTWANPSYTYGGVHLSVAGNAYGGAQLNMGTVKAAASAAAGSGGLSPSIGKVGINQ